MRIDLNSDLGESFGAWSMGQDAALMDSISSANVACGFHAGDPGTMRATIALARAKGVAIGAHPGFPDLVGFGRREMKATPAEVEDFVLYQVAALAGMAAAQGMGVASFFPADFGLAKGVGAQAPNPGFYAPGPYVNSEILIPNHPTMFGYSQKTLPVRYAGGPLLQAGPPAGAEQFAGSSPDKPQVVARFTGGEAGVLSGLMRQPDQIRNRPMITTATPRSQSR